jgi:hypothetical protein
MYFEKEIDREYEFFGVLAEGRGLRGDKHAVLPDADENWRPVLRGYNTVRLQTAAAAELLTRTAQEREQRQSVRLWV